MSFPEEIKVGLRSGGTTYKLSGEVLLEFHGLRGEERGLLPLLAWAGLPTGQRSPHVLARRRSESGLLRVPEDKGDGLVSQLADLGATSRKAPVYYEAGRGPESAASPIWGAISLGLKSGESRGAVSDWLRDQGYVLDGDFSEWIAPCLYFYRPAGSPGPAPDPATLLDELRGRREVASADFEWIKLRALAGQPNDPLLKCQSNLRLIGMDKAFDLLDPAARTPVKLAVIDSGFDFGHLDLQFADQADRLDLVQHLERIEGGLRNLGDPRLHGTAVAGIAAAKVDNGLGIAGIAGLGTIVPVSLGMYPTSSGLAAGLRFAIGRGARVVNMSVAVCPTACVDEAVKAAWDAGLVLCAAVGNDPVAYAEYPASHPSVIGVGGANRRGLLKTQDGDPCVDDNGLSNDWNSRYGAGLAMLAPGVNCWTTYPVSGGGSMRAARTGEACGPVPGYQSVCGTSAASAHAAGLAALIRSVKPALTNQRVREIIETTCEKVGPYTYARSSDHPNGTWSLQAGYGLMDCLSALKLALSGKSKRARSRRTAGRQPAQQPA